MGKKNKNVTKLFCLAMLHLVQESGNKSESVLNFGKTLTQTLHSDVFLNMLLSVIS